MYVGKMMGFERLLLVIYKKAPSFRMGLIFVYSHFRSICEYQHTPPKIRIPPRIWNTVGISAKRTAAMAAAATGSQSLEADTKDGEKYFRHQENTLWPRMVGNNASRNPMITIRQP